MLEGLPPHAPTRRLRLAADETTARRIADFLMESFDPAQAAASAFENEATGRWEMEVYFSGSPDEEALRELVAMAAGTETAMAVVFDDLTERDWVRASLEGLRLVKAGRFVVHGRHDRAAVPANAIGIEIEAALAFGTGHHGTTRGCLLMLDTLLNQGRPRKILDLGTGTGVLAIAAARAVRRSVAAGDIDPVAVEVACGNARANRAARWVRPVAARGTAHPVLQSGGPYDLVFANILARPLVRLAPDLARLAGPSARLVLSGLIGHDVAGVLSAYRSQGFHLIRRSDLEGWATLLLARGGAHRLPPRHGKRRSGRHA